MWYYAESNEHPQTVDDTSSKNWVYVRRNIEEHERVDEMTGDAVTYYAYEEIKLPKDTYPIYQQEQANAANLDYIAMMTDIDLEDEEEGK